MEGTTGSSFSGINHDYQQEFGSPNMTGSPERRLLLAILERAILDFVGNDLREIAEAEEWIFSYNDISTAGNFSFSWVCEQLDLDRNKISQKIRSMPRRGARKVAPWYFQKSASITQ